MRIGPIRRQHALNRPRPFGRLSWVACIVGLLGLGLIIGACRARAEAQDTAPSVAQMHLAVSPQPPIVGSARLDLTVASPDGKPITGATLQIRGDMNMAGMQPVLADLQDRGNGHYEASDFQFTMAGDWILTVSGSLPDGTPVKKTLTIAVVADKGGSATTGSAMVVPMAHPTPTR
jgi:hypothetical protein